MQLPVPPIALFGILAILILAVVNWAEAVLMPLTLAVLLHFVFSPFIRWMKRLGLAPSLGAFVVVALLVGTSGLVAWRLGGPAMSWMQRLPEELPKIESKLRQIREPIRTIEEASEQVEKIADSGTSHAVKVEIQEPGLSALLLEGVQHFLIASGTVLILLYFLLASEGVFQSKLVRVIPRFKDKKRAVDVIQSIEQDLSRFLLTNFLVGLAVGVAESLALATMGMPNPVLWGTMAAFMNWIPYAGAIVGSAIVGLAAFTVFDSVGYAVFVTAVFYAITSVEGAFITPFILGKQFTLNRVVLLIWLALWTWMWGLVGSLIAVPLLAALRIVCDKVDSLSPLGEFLSDRDGEGVDARRLDTRARTP